MVKRIGIAIVLLNIVVGVAEARAEGAAFFVFGANVGGNVNVLTDDGVDLATAFENSPLFGVRVGSYGFPVGFEGSLVYSPSALVGGVFDGAIDATTNILYTEANLLLIVLPGPISPFVTAGAGIHYLDFNIADLATTSRTKFGWNVGGGLKLNFERVGVRFDVRDHVTTLGLSDFGLGSLGGALGLSTTDARIHNVEVSVGVGIRF